eukprot:1681084-Rhodomonas_salina.1
MAAARPSPLSAETMMTGAQGLTDHRWQPASVDPQSPLRWRWPRIVDAKLACASRAAKLRLCAARTLSVLTRKLKKFGVLYSLDSDREPFTRTLHLQLGAAPFRFLNAACVTALITWPYPLRPAPASAIATPPPPQAAQSTPRPGDSIWRT